MQAMFAALILSLAFCLPAHAADQKAELTHLHAALEALNHEQQSAFLQFQMLQDLRRSNDRAIQAARLGQPRFASGIPSYSDLVQTQRLAEAREEKLAAETDALYLHVEDLRRQKALLHRRIQELSLRR
jgi:hypothetical protein